MTSDYSYSPEDHTDEFSYSSHEDRTVNDLQSAYERRREVEERQLVAVNIWRKKVMFSACLLIVTSGFLLFSEIWYANVVGIAGAFLGIYGALKKNSEFTFVYMVLLTLEFIKNIGIFIYYLNEVIDGHKILLLGVCVIEEIGIVPLSMYYAFKLYRSLGLENKDSDEF